MSEDPRRGAEPDDDRSSTEGKTEPMTVTPENLADLLGPERISPEQARKELPPGVATGLAWTEAGGDVLYVEASLLPHGRGIRLTGQLGLEDDHA